MLEGELKYDVVVVHMVVGVLATQSNVTCGGLQLEDADWSIHRCRGQLQNKMEKARPSSIKVSRQSLLPSSCKGATKSDKEVSHRDIHVQN